MFDKPIFRVGTGKNRKNETFQTGRTPSGGKVVTVKPETYRRALAAAAAADGVSNEVKS